MERADIAQADGDEDDVGIELGDAGLGVDEFLVELAVGGDVGLQMKAGAEGLQFHGGFEEVDGEG